ncbi:MAG: hypothetical protein JSR69_13895 [Proteobacteria bacterium]|nr:hypothetical protein [Pseudomonadota bacterium]
MVLSRGRVFEAMGGTFAQVAKVRLQVGLVCQSAEEIGCASGGVLAAGFFEAEELGERTEP